MTGRRFAWFLRRIVLPVVGVSLLGSPAPASLFQVEEWKTLPAWADEDHAVAPDNRAFAIGGRDGAAVLYSLPDCEEILRLKNTSRAIEAMAFSPDTRWLAIGTDLGMLTVWDLSTREEITSFFVRGTDYRSWRFVFSPDGTRLASFLPGRGIEFFETKKWELISTLKVDGIIGNCRLTFRYYGLYINFSCTEERSLL